VGYGYAVNGSLGGRSGIIKVVETTQVFGCTVDLDFNVSGNPSIVVDLHWDVMSWYIVGNPRLNNSA
jgi:hypothetical protein